MFSLNSFKLNLGWSYTSLYPTNATLTFSSGLAILTESMISDRVSLDLLIHCDIDPVQSRSRQRSRTLGALKEADLPFCLLVVLLTARLGAGVLFFDKVFELNRNVNKDDFYLVLESFKTEAAFATFLSTLAFVLFVVSFFIAFDLPGVVFFADNVFFALAILT